MTPNGTKAVTEVSRLHSAIEAWVTGRMPKDCFAAEIADHLAPEFRIVEPHGGLVHREALINGLWGGWGKNPAFRITIEACEVVEAQQDLVVVTYLERQTGAKLAKPTNARRSTCVFRVGDRAMHVFLHETWVDD